MVVAGYKYRFYPSPSQEKSLLQTFGCVRFVYNKALETRKRHFEETGEGISYNQSSALLTGWKKEEPYKWLNEVSCIPLQQCLRHLQTAYRNFFEKRSGYPNFKNRRYKQSAEFTKSGFRLKGDMSQPLVYLSKQARPLKIRWSRPLPGEVSSITITKDSANRYFVVFKVKFIPQSYKPRTKAVGLDLGLAHAVITSDGVKYDNPKCFKKELSRLKKEQKKLSRKTIGSQNQKKQRVKVARIHAKIKDQRQDWIHKVTTQLVQEYGTICIETLKVSNMMKNRRLSRAIADVSWYEIRRQLEYKTKWYNGKVVAIDQWTPTSKTCSECGTIRGDIPLQVRGWACECGAVHDRDINAARNVLRVGTTQLASGETIIPDQLAA